MPDTPNSRYNAYFGFFMIGIVAFVLTLIAGWLEALYAVFFFLAGLNLIFTTAKTPDPDVEHSTNTHFEVYSRDNVFNYILAAVLVVEALLYFFIPISKPIVILVMWAINVFGYPRLVAFFSTRLGKIIVGSYLQEQLPELNRVQIKLAVNKLNSNPVVSPEELAAEGKFSVELASRLGELYNTYLERTGL